MRRPIKRKVLAYVTHRERLLLFRHTAYPEAGIQVPAGTVEGDEGLEQAVLREASEETGLQHLSLVSYLGSQDLSFMDGDELRREQRHFFHLAFQGDAPESWLHWEEHPSEGPDERLEFAFFWQSLHADVPALAGAQDAMLAGLRDQLRRSNRNGHA